MLLLFSLDSVVIQNDSTIYTNRGMLKYKFKWIAFEVGVLINGPIPKKTGELDGDKILPLPHTQLCWCVWLVCVCWPTGLPMLSFPGLDPGKVPPREQAHLPSVTASRGLGG